jgi:rSAM/selenodomain-associated transferase 1
VTLATTAIGIMCKAPRAGRTKTRLAAHIGVAAAAELSACFLRDVAAAIEAVPIELGRTGYAVYAPAGTEAELRHLFPAGFGLMLQAGRELGNALFGAMRDLLAAGHDGVLLVNGDSPTLPPSYLANALGMLRQPGDRIVLGPAADGGYYLIGLKQPHVHLFEAVPWGTSSVAQTTRQRAAELGLAVAELPEWYDVDDVETLAWLRAELAGNPGRFRDGSPAAATRTWLAKQGEAVP